MTSWVRGGVFERNRFTSWPSPGGDIPLFDMAEENNEELVNDHVLRSHQRRVSKLVDRRTHSRYTKR